MDQRDQEEKNEQPNLQQSTPIQAYFNFTKTMIGIGVIAFPFATESVGWLYAMCLGLPILFIGIKANLLLIEIADHIGQDRLFFPVVARLTLGNFFGWIVELFIIFLQIGLCIAYLIFLTEAIIISLEKIEILLPKYIVFALTLILIIPLSMIRKMHSFHKISKYGLYFGLAALLILLIESIYIIYLGNHSFQKPINARNTLRFFALALLICEGIVPSLTIRDSMANKFKFKQVAIYSLGTAFFVSFLVSFSAVLAYNQNIQDIVLFNITNPYTVSIALILYSISLMLTYPVQLFPAIQILEEFFVKNQYTTIEDDEHLEEENQSFFVDEIGEFFVRFSIMALIYLVAYYVPHFSHFLELIGSVFLSAIFFIFPALMHMVHFKNFDIPQPIVMYTILLVVGFSSLSLGTIDSFYALFFEE